MKISQSTFKTRTSMYFLKDTTIKSRFRPHLVLKRFSRHLGVTLNYSFPAVSLDRFHDTYLLWTMLVSKYEYNLSYFKNTGWEWTIRLKYIQTSQWLHIKSQSQCLNTTVSYNGVFRNWFSKVTIKKRQEIFTELDNDRY